MEANRIGSLCGLSTVVVLFGCGGSTTPAAGAPGASSLVSTTAIAAGAQCAAGGVQIATGVDTNGNGSLDTDEIESTEVLCGSEGGGAGALALLTLSSQTPPSETCPYGGVQISIGLDDNSDGALATEEVDSNIMVCGTLAEAFGGLVYLSDAFRKGMPELYRVFADGSLGTKIEGPTDSDAGSVKSFSLSPDKTRVAYLLMDAKANPEIELWVASLVDATLPTRVSGAMVDAGNVAQYGWSPDGSMLAFIADKLTDGTDELFTVYADGTGVKRVSATPVALGNVGSFMWSPTGAWLAYSSDLEVINKNELYVVRPTGGELTKINPVLDNGENVGMYEWSPDGSWIAFLADPVLQNQTDLFKMDMTPTPLVVPGIAVTAVDATEAVSEFSWAPNGIRVAFLSSQDTGTNIELFTEVIGGPSDVKKINDPLGPSENVRLFRWSPDSSTLAFVADLTDGTEEVLVRPADNATGVARVCGTTVATDSPGATIAEVQWAPDSSLVAFSGNIQSPNFVELFTAAPTASSPTKLSGALDANENVDRLTWAWAPDGSVIAYLADKDIESVNELYTVTPNGATEYKINSVLAVPKNCNNFTWSADSETLAYTTDLVKDSVLDLYTAPARGGVEVRISVAARSTDGDPNGVTAFSW